MKGRSFWITSCAKRITTRKSSQLINASRIFEGIPDAPNREPELRRAGARKVIGSVWLNETNEWIYPHLHVAQERMTELARRSSACRTALPERALETGRARIVAGAGERLAVHPAHRHQSRLRQARVKDHLLRFIALHDQLTSTTIDPAWLASIEQIDNIFPNVNYHYWA